MHAKIECHQDLLQKLFNLFYQQVRENLEAAEIEALHEKPWAEILTCFGFFLIYFIEEIVHFFTDSGVAHDHSETIQVHRSFSIHSHACEAGTTDVQQTPESKYLLCVISNILFESM